MEVLAFLFRLVGAVGPAGQAGLAIAWLYVTKEIFAAIIFPFPSFTATVLLVAVAIGEWVGRRLSQLAIGYASGQKPTQTGRGAPCGLIGCNHRSSLSDQTPTLGHNGCSARPTNVDKKLLSPKESDDSSRIRSKVGRANSTTESPCVLSKTPDLTSWAQPPSNGGSRCPSIHPCSNPLTKIVSSTVGALATSICAFATPSARSQCPVHRRPFDWCSWLCTQGLVCLLMHCFCHSMVNTCPTHVALSLLVVAHAAQGNYSATLSPQVDQPESKSRSHPENLPLMRTRVMEVCIKVLRARSN
eukprot:GHVT01080063.1.p1 GENE.GHVT01080063.1~~GHVT01080063.1.p1  ORF type:complete len:301 (+),score=8.95 GHVT01080063.1:83-985(+)